MVDREAYPPHKIWSPMEPHDEFLELCAVSTSGQLTEEEQRKLQEHLAICPECREAMKQFGTVVDRAVPALSADLSPESSDLNPSESAPSGQSTVSRRPRREGASHQRRSFQTRLGSYESWLPCAAGLLFLLTVGVFLHRVSAGRNVDSAQTEQPVDPGAAQSPTKAMQGELAAAGNQRDEAAMQLAERDNAIAELRRQVNRRAAELASVTTLLGESQIAAGATESEKNHMMRERDALAQGVQSAQMSLEKMQKDLNTLQRERSSDSVHAASLEAKLAELSPLLADQEKAVDQQQALLDHDRDIRELMGARDLYVAEVYDVEGTGQTRKPCGRVFLTKGKSLIFYAYDLDQELGLKNGNTFQAWGGRGVDRTQALNLGLFYEDKESKKRWVLRSDDPKTLEQIDAVFVTIEPKGGSDKPSGKPLLFARLRLDPNHP